MREDIGRFIEGYLLETTNLIITVYDCALGTGPDAQVFIEGRELVFSRAERGEGPGFLRLLPAEASLTLSFPRGQSLYDPRKRMRGVPNSRTRLTVRGMGDLDAYARRLIEEAYSLDI
jgi:hypothetical protein